MQLIIFIGIPASGKSTFFRENFCDTHVWINLDTLRTRRREALRYDACVQGRTPCVIDNTNLTPAHRERYLGAMRKRKCEVVGYVFDAPVEECLARNALRHGRQCVPSDVIHSMKQRMVMPVLTEGFHRLHWVRLVDGKFTAQAFS